MTRREAVPAVETSALEWQHLDAMLDEAGLESFPASDPPAIMVDEPPVASAATDEANPDERGKHEDA